MRCPSSTLVVQSAFDLHLIVPVTRKGDGKTSMVPSATHRNPVHRALRNRRSLRRLVLESRSPRAVRNHRLPLSGQPKSSFDAPPDVHRVYAPSKDGRPPRPRLRAVQISSRPRSWQTRSQTLEPQSATSHHSSTEAHIPVASFGSAVRWPAFRRK